jgi:hypothetical protein
VPGIVGLRETIWATSRDPAVANGLTIIAPHTHWQSSQPILISAVDRAYRLAPRAPEPGRHYTPVSFFFTRRGPVAYEWADESISFEPADLELVWRAIRAACAELAGKEWPLGLSLNFRFKPLLSDDSIPTLELPEHAEHGHDGPAVIRRADEVLRSHDASEFEQVAWHAYCDLAESLGPAERELLNDIRWRLDGIPSDADVRAVGRKLLRAMRRLGAS